MSVPRLTPLDCVAALFAVAGLWLLVRGLRRRRSGDEPHCRRCGYSLTALTSPNCPECGTPISPATTVYGRRHRRPRTAAAGALLLLLGAAGLGTTVVPALRAVDWYHYRPTSWLIRDLGSGDYVIADRAWDELDRRRALGPLSREHEQQLIEAILAEQGKAQGRTPLLRAMMEDIARRADAGELSPAQFERLCKQALRARLEQRPVVVAGEQMTLHARAAGPIPDVKRWRTKVIFLGASCGDQQIIGGSSGIVHGLWLSSGATFTAPGPGRHPAKIAHRIEISPEDEGDEGANRPPTLAWEQVLTGMQDVEATPSADNPRLVASPTALEVAGCVVATIDWRAGCASPQADIRISQPPENVAFDIFLRHGGHETKVGETIREKGDNGSQDFSLPPVTANSPARSIDLIFRSSPRLARTTSDLMQIWDGEVVLHDLPVPAPFIGPPQYDTN
jgi:hypothetical protein